MKLGQAKRRCGIDTSVNISAEMAALLVGAGYYTFFRYVDYNVNVNEKANRYPYWPEMLSVQELNECLGAGADVSLVQRRVTQDHGGGLDYNHGYQFGRAAALNAKLLGSPDGLSVWCDAEGWPDRTPDQIMAYLKGWCGGAISKGAEPVGYIGGGLGSDKTGYVTGEMLWSLPFKSYWRGAAAVPQVLNRGWDAIQGTQIGDPAKGIPGLFPDCPGYHGHGLIVDQNMIALDHMYFSDRAKGDPTPGGFAVLTA